MLLRRICLLSAVLLAAAGCPGDERVIDPCQGVVCGAHASCNATSGECACEAGYSGNATGGCVEDVHCTETTCNSHGTCSEQSGAPVCACTAGWAGDNCQACATDYASENGACINEKLVDCAAPTTLPDNAQAVSAKVTVTFVNGIWATPATCATECKADYVAEGAEGACINEKQVDCIAPTTTPAHAQVVEAQVSVVYADGEWATAATCETECVEDYVAEGTAGACINEKMIPCLTPTLPANSQAVVVNVPVTYADGVWSTATACETECKPNYVAEGAAGACINEKLAPCIAPATIPDNAKVVPVDVTVIYSGSAWATAAFCATECITDYVAEGTAGACINEKLVACATPDAIPTNMHAVTADVTVIYTGGNWAPPAPCELACDAGYVGATCTDCDTGYALLEGACVLDACAAAPCMNAGECANTSSGFTCDCGEGSPYAGMTCEACAVGYAALPASPVVCVTDLCAADTCVANATCSMADATTTACACNAGYADEGGACINSKEVECDATAIPANSTATVVPVTANYVNGVWVTPACAFTCVADYHQSGASCVANTVIMNCHVWPDTYAGVTGSQEAFIGMVNTNETATVTGQTPGIDGKFCYSAGPVVLPEHLSDPAVICQDAAFLRETTDGVNDEYETIVEFAEAGVFNYVYAFSGDGKQTWTVCNASLEDVSGRATITEPVGTLIFSEYVEGGSLNKAVEVYNATGAPQNLSGCTISLHTSAAVAASKTYAFPSVELPAGETFVLCHGDIAPAFLAECDGTDNAVINHNGNDAFVLACNGEVLDVFGQLGTDPLTAWGTGDFSTKDRTLRRMCSVKFGDTDGTDAFDPAAEWVSFAKDALDGIGKHCPVVADACNPNPCKSGGTCTLDTTAATGFICACSAGYTGDTCAECATDYVNEGAGCINTKSVPCIEPATLPANSEAVVVPVPVTYASGTWSVAATCATTCIAGFIDEGGCINTKDVSCIAPATLPANAESVDALVPVTYVDNAWTTAATCATACIAGFIDEGGCINTKDVYCLAPATLPANAESVDALVPVTYVDNAWTTAATCATACIAGFVSVDGACIDNACNPDPCNGHSSACSTTAAGVFSCTCSGNFAGTDCSVCATGYTLTEGACVADVVDYCASAPCLNGGSCASNSGSFTCTCDPAFDGPTCSVCAENYVALEQTPLNCVQDLCIGNPCGVNGSCSMASAIAYACVCEGDYTFENGSCINTKTVACDAAGIPENSIASTDPVTANFVSGAWVIPACTWTCDVANNFGLVGTDLCLHSQSVACTTIVAPDNASMVPGNVTIVFDGSVWGTPANCTWACNADFHLSGGACVANVTIGWCNVQFPKDFTGEAGDAMDFYGEVYAAETGTTIGAAAPGIDAKFCYGVGPITAATDLASLLCSAAEYNKESGNNDEYMAIADFNTVGAYDYVYAFSGDGMATWKLCDADDRDTDWATGKAMILAPFAVVSATATSATTVEVKFNRDVNAASVAPEGTQFDVLDADASALVVSAAAVSGSVVTLTVAAQTSQAVYTVFIDSTVTALVAEAGLPANTSSTFVGYTAVLPLNVLTAVATSNTEVMVAFDRIVDAATVGVEDFTITPALSVTAVAISGPTVTLTTESQEEATEYTVTVSGVAAADGGVIGLSSNSATFIGEAAAAGHLVINKIAAAGVTADDEYIELYNASASDIDLSTYAIWYSSAGGSAATRKAAALTGVLIPAGKHLLLATTLYKGTMPKDVLITLQIAANGTIWLTNTTVAPTSVTAANVVDVVGYGTLTSVFYEGTGSAPVGSATNMVARKVDGLDTNDNKADFEARAHDPKNLSF